MQRKNIKTNQRAFLSKEWGYPLIYFYLFIFSNHQVLGWRVVGQCKVSLLRSSQTYLPEPSYVCCLCFKEVEKFVTMTFSLCNRGREHSAMSATI